MPDPDRPRVRRPPTEDGPLLPDVTADEEPDAWTERREQHERDDWYRRERPPHHE